MIICMPTSLLQEVGAALGAQAGEARLREVIGAGGSQSVRRATQTPLNMLLEARLGTRAFRRLMGGDRPTAAASVTRQRKAPGGCPVHSAAERAQLHLPLAESQDQTNASSDDLGRERCPDGGPMVRIHLPPADSQSLSRRRF